MQFINITSKGDYVIAQMARPKVNAINQQMVDEIRATFRSLESDESVKGVILTGLPGVFSAGLDLIELYDYDKEQMKKFFIDFGLMHIELVKFTKPLICAITGHSPAGGTVIAIAGDYRVMAEGEKFTLGLNEVAVNVQISNILIYAYSVWVGQSRAYRYIMAGKLLNNQEALDAGLIDKVVPMEEVLPTAEKRMKKFLQADLSILINTKAKLRSEWLKYIDASQSEEELEVAMKAWWNPEVRMRMQMFKAMLKAKKTASN